MSATKTAPPVTGQCQYPKCGASGVPLFKQRLAKTRDQYRQKFYCSAHEAVMQESGYELLRLAAQY
jgi:hypothetical protein